MTVNDPTPEPVPDKNAGQSAGDPSEVQRRAARRDLLVVSILALFCELLIIRWLATEVRIFAYFKNLPLMSAFLGLGLGFIWVERPRDYFRWSALGLLYMSGVLIFALGLSLTYLSFVDPSQFMLFGVKLGDANAAGIWPSLRSLAIMLALFALSASIFVGFGQRMGKSFAQLKPLEAYSINVAGSLAGSVLFSLLSWTGTSPGIWLLVAAALFCLVKRQPAVYALAVLALLYSLVLAPYIARANYGPDFVKTVWSPYYRIDVIKVRQKEGPYKGEPLGYNLYINYDSFQSILDCTAQSMQRFPRDIQEVALDSYSKPFRVLGRAPEQVLVLGSGAGNDVAAALRLGARSVDAVEIDPAIIAIGRQMHPEHPYSSPRVHVHIMDARTFLKNCQHKYDVIVFGALDSHAAFSSLSSLRLDNYVFTREALSEAAGLLKPDGHISVSFVVVGDWLWDRQAKTLAQATGMTPHAYCVTGDQVGGLLLAGPGLKDKAPGSLPIKMPMRPVNLDSPVPVPRDDWPFLFLPRQELPTLYILPILAVLLVACAPVARYFASGARTALNWQMLGLGMGFMLLEVRAMADLSLLFGSTWVVNSVIISGVMVVILVANWIAWHSSPSRIPVIGAGLLITLALTTFINAGELSRWGSALGGLAGSVMYLFPLIFASTIFALLFKGAQVSTTAFAFNLVGGVVGVCLEYLSMWLGVRALGWVAVAIYVAVLASYLAHKRSHSASQEPQEALADQLQARA